MAEPAGLVVLEQANDRVSLAMRVAYCEYKCHLPEGWRPLEFFVECPPVIF